MSIFKNKTFYTVLLIGILVVCAGLFNAKPAHATVVATITSAKVIAPTQVQIVFNHPLNWVIGNFTTLNIGGVKTVSSIAETAPSATVTITFTGGAVNTDATGTINIAAISDSGSGYSFAGQTGQGLADGQSPTVTSAKITAANTITVVYSEAVNTVAGDYTGLVLTAGGSRTVTGISGSGTATISLTFSGAAAATSDTATMAIASTVHDLVSNPLVTVSSQSVTDGQSPTVTSAKITAAHTITVVYSEPVTTVAGDYGSLTLSPGGSRNVSSISGSGTATIALTFDGAASATNATATMNIAATVVDTSPSTNALVAVTGQVVSDAQAPTITSIALTNPTTITVTYSETVKTPATSVAANWTLSGGAGSPAITAVSDIHGTPATTQTITISGYAGGQLQLAYSSVGGQPITDNSAALNALATTSAANVVDSTVPTIVSRVLTNSTTITVTYSEQVTTPATSSTANWVLSGGTGSPTITAVSDIHTTPSLTQTITISGYTGGQLQLAYTTSGGSPITDSSAALNALANAGAADATDTIVPTFTASRTAVNTIVLTFSETVTGTAILNSFTVVGASAVTNTAVTNGTSVTLTTTGLTATNGTPNVSYVPATGNIHDGATTPNYVGSGAVAASDHVKPTLTSAKLTGPNTITVVYSEPVTSTASDYANLVFMFGGTRNVTSVSGSGTATIVLTFDGAATATSDSATMDIAATVVDTSPATNALTAITGQAVTDAQPPTFTADRTALNTIVLNFTENILGDAIDNSFTVDGASDVTNTAPGGSTTITLTTTGLTSTSGTPVVNYVAATGDITDNSAATNEVANGGAVPATDNVPPTFTAARTALNTIVLTFSENVDTTTISGEGYAVAGATVVSNTDPAGTSNTITLTTSGLTNYNGTPAVTYTRATGTTVDASAQANEVANGYSVNATDLVSPFTPTSSLIPGSYSGTQYTALASTGSTSVRYTTDGSTPSCTSGTVYTGSITISASETISAIGCDDATITNTSSVATFSYTIGTAGSGGNGGAVVSGGGGGYGYSTPVTTTTVTTPVVTPSTVVGCKPGDKFSASNGMACPSIPVASTGCTATTKYSSTTGMACPVGIISATFVPQTNTSGAFTRSLTVGSVGNDVKALQQFLNAHGFAIATTGAGSKGNESTTFGGKTKAALAKFQAANGISPASGFFGPLTRSFISSMK